MCPLAEMAREMKENFFFLFYFVAIITVPTVWNTLEGFELNTRALDAPSEDPE